MFMDEAQYAYEPDYYNWKDANEPDYWSIRGPKGLEITIIILMSFLFFKACKHYYSLYNKISLLIWTSIFQNN